MLPQHPKLRSGALAASRRWWLPRCSLLRCAPRVPPAFPSKSTCLDGLIKGFLPFLNHIRLVPLPFLLSPAVPLSRYTSGVAQLCFALLFAPSLLLVSRLHLSPIPLRAAPLCHRIAPRRSPVPDRSFLCAFCRSTTARAPPFPADLIHHRRRSNI